MTGSNVAEAPTTPPSSSPGRRGQRGPRAARAVLGSVLLGFLLRRGVITVVLLVGVTLVSFLLIQAVPGDTMSATLSEQALQDPEIVAAYRARWGLDEPLYVQYLVYMRNVLQGDLGVSQQTGRPVLADLLTYVPATLEIAVPAMLLSLVLGVAIGLFAAVRHDRAGDHAVRAGTLIGLSTPPFWLALVVLYVFFYLLGVSPSGGRLSTWIVPPERVTGSVVIDSALAGRWDAAWDAIQHTALPVLVLTVLTVAMLVRFVRSAMLEVLDADYVRAARAKGLPTSRVLTAHVLRAGLVPVITVSGLAFASMLSGTVLVEQIFSWPGVGQYAFRSASALDVPAVLGVSLFVAVVYTVVNLLVDLAYGLIDPRIRLS